MRRLLISLPLWLATCTATNQSADRSPAVP
jgi:hypothetical protein